MNKVEKNLTAWAFPCTENTVDPGFTKHEYAAILIAQGLVPIYTLNTSADQKIIAQLSKELAGEILAQFA